MSSGSPRPAVFLDRDGTINVDTHYVSRPEDVALIPGAAPAIARLNAAGFPVIVVSNQSGIGRGYLTMEEYQRVEQRLAALLAEQGARVDATYICPHAPSTPPCDCRKPGTALYHRAAAEHAIDLARSWFIGDRWRDIAPARVLGGRGILVPNAGTPDEDRALATREMEVAEGLEEAVGRVLGERG